MHLPAGMADRGRGYGVANEREVRKETTWLGEEKEVIYEEGKKVGEVKSEKRGGFLGIGAETVRVERDNNGRQVTYEREENRGGFFGVGSTPTQVKYGPDGNVKSFSQIETRGSVFGIGGNDVRIERDADGSEIGQVRWERRGGFLGLGGERVRVSTRTEQASRSNTNSSTAKENSDRLGHAGPSRSSINTRKKVALAPSLFIISYLIASGWRALQFSRNNATDVNDFLDVIILILLLPGMLFWTIVKIIFVVISLIGCSIFSNSSCHKVLDYFGI